MATVNVKRELKKMMPHLIQARDENLNEADTILRLIKFFENVLDFDPMSEISREAEMKKQFVDIILKVDGVVRILVEAKSAGTKLRDRHIDQANSYASKNNYPWVLLTNGVEWNLYHLTFGEGIEYVRAFAVDLGDQGKFDEACIALALLHKSSIRRGLLDEFWQQRTALRADSLGSALFNDRVIALIRREIRKKEGMLVDPEDLAVALHEMLTPEARELIGPVRIRKTRSSQRRRRPSPGAATTDVPKPPSEPGA